MVQGLKYGVPRIQKLVPEWGQHFIFHFTFFFRNGRAPLSASNRLPCYHWKEYSTRIGTMLLTASPTTPIHTFHGMGVMPMLPSLTQLDVQRTTGNMMTTSRPRLMLPVSWLLLLPKMFGYHSTTCIWSTMWSRSWVLAHERENMHWCHVQVLQSSYCSVWQSLSERTNNQRHCPPLLSTKRGVSWNVEQHR
jgi:hypothetical protein